MRTHTISKIWGALAAACLAALAVHAQQNKIEDQDLLTLLDQVNDQSTAPAVQQVEPSASPTASATDMATVSDMESGDTNTPVSDATAGSDDATVDDLNMGTFDAAQGSTSENLISVRLNRVGLEEAINLFAQLSGANIIVPELTDAAQISVNLKDVEWRPALQSILDTYDYELYQRVAGSNVYSVRRRPAGAPEPQVVETFVLKYATVPNAAELIRQLLPDNAKVSEFASRNMIVVKSTESSLGEVRAVLENIDKVREQVFIESKFMELTDDAQKDLGIDWSVLQAYSAGTKGNTTKSYSKTDDSSKTWSKFLAADGSTYNDASGYTHSGDVGADPVLEGMTPTLEDIATHGSSEVLTSVLSADEFRLVLSAMQQNKGVNIVSNPKIIVANEELANISIIRKEPNLKQSRQQALNNTPDTITFELDKDQPFFDFGIKLDVIPSINTSSNITVQINPSLTRKFADKTAGQNTYPIIDEKSIKTIFNLASGQTAAIGGLTEATESEEEHTVPLLGSIPLLGRLFSWTQTVHGQDETIIFVTVGLANTDQLDSETGMPADAELARRQVIQDHNSQILREHGRQYYESNEDDKLQDMIKVMDSQETSRLEERQRAREKEAKKALKRAKNDNMVVSQN